MVGFDETEGGVEEQSTREDNVENRQSGFNSKNPGEPGRDGCQRGADSQQ